MESNEQKDLHQPQETTNQSASKSITGLFQDYPVIFLTVVVTALIVIAWIAPTAFIDLLKVLISWPLIVAILVITFKDQMAEFIKYLDITYRTKGGDVFQFQNSQSATRLSEASKTVDKKDPDPADTKVLKDQVDNLIQVAAGLEQEKRQIIEGAAHLLKQQGEAVVYWWFQYLSCFLVFNTKMVLSWFANQQTGITEEFFRSYWRAAIQPPEELKAVFFALVDHGLIANDDNGLFWITKGGREFLDFLRARNCLGVPPWSI
jgi:hypothetical protein